MGSYDQRRRVQRDMSMVDTQELAADGKNSPSAARISRVSYAIEPLSGRLNRSGKCQTEREEKGRRWLWHGDMVYCVSDG
jgi:hypothetical protein